MEELRPSPPVIYETLWKMGYSPYQLVQDFSHQQYEGKSPQIIIDCDQMKLCITVETMVIPGNVRDDYTTMVTMDNLHDND